MYDGHVKFVKCSGTQNVSDVLTKNLARPVFEKHREHVWGTRVPFSYFFSTVENKCSNTNLDFFSIVETKCLKTNLVFQLVCGLVCGLWVVEINKIKKDLNGEI